MCVRMSVSQSAAAAKGVHEQSGRRRRKTYLVNEAAAARAVYPSTISSGGGGGGGTFRKINIANGRLLPHLRGCHSIIFPGAKKLRERERGRKGEM